MNHTRTKICSLMARKRLTVEDVLVAIDPDWADHYPDASTAFDEYMDEHMLETVRGL